MTYFPDGLPEPEAGFDDAPFWDGCQSGRLLVQRCAGCARHRHPPSPLCPACRSQDVLWRELDGNGEVFSYTIVDHPSHSVLRGHTPYNIVVVMLDDADEVRIVSNVIDAAPHEFQIGLRVKLVWEVRPSGKVIPRFRKAAR